MGSLLFIPFLRPMVLPNDFFTPLGASLCKLAESLCKLADYIIGPDQLMKAPPELLLGPHGNTELEVELTNQ